MSKYFAKIENDVVVQVVVADSQEWCEDNLGGEWVETFMDNPKKNYAGVGHSYHRSKKNFFEKQPFTSWKLDKDLKWQPPIKKPAIHNDFFWDESKQEWVEYNKKI